MSAIPSQGQTKGRVWGKREGEEEEKIQMQLEKIKNANSGGVGTLRGW